MTLSLIIVIVLVLFWCGRPLAQVKIGDGSVQTLWVRASDRCKDAAERFVSENSLKAE